MRYCIARMRKSKDFLEKYPPIAGVGSLRPDVHHLDALHLDALLQPGQHLVWRQRRGSSVFILNWEQGYQGEIQPNKIFHLNKIVQIRFHETKNCIKVKLRVKTVLKQTVSDDDEQVKSQQPKVNNPDIHHLNCLEGEKSDEKYIKKK